MPSAKILCPEILAEVRDLESTVTLYVGETARHLLAALPDLLDKEHEVPCMFGSGLRSDVWSENVSGQPRFSNSLAALRVSSPLLITVGTTIWQMLSAVTQPLNDLFSEKKSFPSACILRTQSDD